MSSPSTSRASASSGPDASSGSGRIRSSVVARPEAGHQPVMVEEVMQALSPVPGSLQVDATLGGGGHAVRLREANAPDGRLLGLDADQAAIARCAVRLASFGERAVLRQANFEELAGLAPAAGFGRGGGGPLDLGPSPLPRA